MASKLEEGKCCIPALYSPIRFCCCKKGRNGAFAAGKEVVDCSNILFKISRDGVEYGTCSAELCWTNNGVDDGDEVDEPDMTIIVASFY